jgi:type IV pilus assembly protein PilW
VTARTTRHAGFSLIELMIGMALALVLAAVIVTVFSRASKTSSVTQTINEIQEQARVAMDMLQQDVRLAGYIGCNSNRLLESGGLVNVTAAPTAYLNNIDQYILGHEGTGAVFDPAPAAGAGLATADPVPLTGSDAITVRIPAAEPASLSGTMANGTAAVPLFSTAGFAVGQRAVIGDCTQSTAFYVTGLAGGLQHVDGAGLNATATFGRAYGPDAMVAPYTTLSYYVGVNGAGNRSLYRRVGDTALSEEIAEGVDEFQLQYGLDTDGDIFADLFVPADDVADWSQVVSVRASLLMRSKLERAAQTQQVYDFNGATDIAAADDRLRRPFNVTIQLRNRTL